MEKTSTKDRYIRTVGRRKTSTAVVKLTPATKTTFVINGKPIETYFFTPTLVHTVKDAFTIAGVDKEFTVTVTTKGGGISSQAQAVRHGIARALVDFDEETRGKLKSEGYLKRDPRAKERRKFGLKKARKAPTWSKR